ncbi:ABC transporter permease [Rhodococcus antarcticus]|uniref:ABC transporter permease n=1 Tax=Rhodococcus antarcticus TaxID=2987751 RepID=A0ABY6P346_9NOCA|nr:ABC transporter permease [Rhodococcus antarcticus]UZJ25761.1 ABC transporter permease [Rhodococcus antarcticus]
MGRYVVRRLLQMIPAFLGTTLLIYVLVFAVPGDPLAGKCGDRPCPPAFVAKFTAEYNLNDNVLVQYVKYIGNLLQGNFGVNFSGRSVSDIILGSYPVTVKLALVALTFEIVFGLTAGVLTGLGRKGFVDNLVLVGTLVLIALPVFVTAYLLQLYLGIKWGIFSATVSTKAPLQELIMPGFVLASLSLAYATRITRTSIVENSRADYVRTAKAKGLPQRRIVGVHLLRNSLIPVVTFFGTDLGALMAGAIVTEGIFNINGIGRETYRAIVTKDGATVTGIVVVLVLVYLVANLLVDLLYAVLDPRIRYE